MKAKYDLGKRIAGFDFFNWLVMQQPGTVVSFDARNPKSSKFSANEILKRYESILKPGCALAGMSYDELGDGLNTRGCQRELVDHVRAGGHFIRLKSVLPPGKERYTVTLRNFRRFPHRNSNERDWRAFAGEIGARVIPDYEDEPIHLHERMALYAGAEMNFFVTNGPVMLCFLSEYPAMGFDVQNSPMTPIGIPMGESYPYLLPQHKQIYEPGELTVIRKHFEEWRERMG